MGKWSIPEGSVYSNWAAWAAILLGVVDNQLGYLPNWDTDSQGSVPEQLGTLRYILPLLGQCVAALEEVSMKFFVVAHKENQNANGGTTQNNTDNVIPLNYEVFDPDDLVALSNNNAVVEAGTWLFLAFSGVFDANHNHPLIYDVDGSAVLGRGISSYFNSPYSIYGIAPVIAPCIITAPKTVSLRHFTETGAANQGGGLPSNQADEIYAIFVGFKMA